MKDILNYIPGFRSQTKWKMILSGLYYLFCLALIISHAGAGLEFLSMPFIAFYGISLIRNKDKKFIVPLAFAIALFGTAIAITPNTGEITKAPINRTDGLVKVAATKTPEPTQSPTVTTTATPRPTEEPKQEIKVTDVQTHSGQLKVHFIDVGQADSILVQTPSGKAMLIDAGNNADGANVVSYIHNQGVNKIDVLVGTHPHEDHIGGMDNIINNFDIGKFYMPKVTTTTDTFKDVLAAAKNKGLKVTTATAGINIDLDPALKVEMFAPNSEKYEDLNNYSAVIKLTYGNNSFLLTGDAQEQSESEMLSKGYDLKADVLKVGHHGSNTSTSPAFLKTVSPKYAVISCGKGNDYGHPHQVTIDKLNNAGVQVFRTDESGTIVATGDGDNITFDKKASAIKENAPPAPVVLSNNNASTTTDSNTSYIGNKNSKVFHRSTCSSLPADKNRVYFKSRDEAVNAGYRPCQKCNP